VGKTQYQEENQCYFFDIFGSFHGAVSGLLKYKAGGWA
jgi:hypothetical protein